MTVQRWKEISYEASTPEGRVAELFRELPGPKPLSAEQLGRIERGIQARLALEGGGRLPRWLKRLIGGGLFLGAALAFAAATRLWRAPARAPSPAPIVELPAHAPLPERAPELPRPTPQRAQPPAAAKKNAVPRQSKPPAGPSLEEETRLLRRVLQLRAVEREPVEALGALAEYRDRFHSPRLLSEVEIEVLQAELLLEASRFPEAVVQFDAVLAASSARAVEERALFGRALARAGLGDGPGSLEDLNLYLNLYLERFPAGRFSERARQLNGAK